MRFVLWVAGVAFVFLTPLQSAEKESPRPPFRTIQLTYQATQLELDIGGNPFITTKEEGVRTIAVDQGKKRIEKKIVKTSRHKTTESHIIRLINSERTAILRPDRMVAFYFEQRRSTSPVWIEVTPDDDTYLGEEEYLDRDCDIYKTKDQTLWVWENLILKQELKKGNIVKNMTVTKIQQDGKVDPSLFDIPPEYEILPVFEIQEEKTETLDTSKTKEK